MSSIDPDLNRWMSSASSNGDSARMTHIRPPRRFSWIEFRELWRYRELFLFLTWRDIKVRYKQTVIGAGWAILQPVLMMIVFSVFLGRMAGFSGGDVPYPVFVFAGLVPWTFFATSISFAGNSVVGSEKLITKIYFPRIIIPIAATGTAFVDALIASSVMIVMLLATGTSPTASWLLAPLLLLAISLCATGVGMWLAALNVAYRDFRYVIPFLVQLWLFATPSVYMQTNDSRGQVTTGRFGGLIDFLFTANPMTSLIDAFRAVMTGQPVGMAGLGVALLIAATVFMSGCVYFRRVEHRFADIV